MFIWLSLGLAIVSGVLNPFASRLHATGLWAGKALTPSQLSDSMPQGLQDALTDGWPSWLGLASSLLPFAAGAVGFVYTWWFGPLAFLLALAFGVALSRTRLASPYLDRYLAQLLTHAQRREAKFRQQGDTDRLEAIGELIDGLRELLAIYAGERVHAPDISVAKSAPHGDRTYLLRADQRTHY